MNIENVIAVAIAVLGAGQFVVAMLVTGLRRKFDELKKADEKLGEDLTITKNGYDQRFAALELTVAGRYITREESLHAREEMMRQIAGRFDRLEQLLANKVDRIDCVRIHDREKS